MRQRFPVLVLVVGLAYAQGCATYRVTIPDSDPQVQTYRGGAMHAYFWGKWYAPEVMAAECQGEGVNDVVITRTYLQDLASVFTFGIWMPADVQFRCKAPHGDKGEFPKAPR
jgi:Bor protein